MKDVEKSQGGIVKLRRSFARLDGGACGSRVGFIPLWDHILRMDRIITCADLCSDLSVERRSFWGSEWRIQDWGNA